MAEQLSETLISRVLMRIAAVTSFVVLLVVLFYCCTNDTAKHSASFSYAGTEKCQSCHKKQFDLYLSSDHFHAMDSAQSRSVLGDFNNSFFVYYGDTSFFYRREGHYYIKTKDTTGIKKEFLVSFTFGWRPLQQYLVRFDDGRIQVLPFCWDTRPKEKGGQRWFHIYNKENILPDDELFWMSYNQNWNYMCADCHTTNFAKSYQADENKFSSTWNENKVSCESCHGPASGHIEWAGKANADDKTKGFSISLATKNIRWKMDDTKGTALPEQVIHNDTLIETCSRCHARATRFTDEYHHGQSFLQSHIPATVNTDNYYIDGQIKDEDYEYGSFLQSKMYAAGVTCINCHEPHSMKLKAEGNKVCASCHSPAKFNTVQHTHHKENSTGSQCVNCHMPVTTYMVVDDRRDHSIRIPRPDLSIITGTPNACNKCHSEKSVKWAAESFVNYYGSLLPKEKTYGELMYNISKYITESEPSLYALLTSKKFPAVIKASAVERYNLFSSGRVTEQVLLLLRSDDPNLRLNALHAVTNFPPEKITAEVSPLLNDPVKAVRLEAVNVLSAFTERLNESMKSRFDAVLNEYLLVQKNLSHRPEGYLNRGIILAQTGKQQEAEQLYLKGIALFPKFIPFYANLADLYRSLNNEAMAKAYIDRGLQLQPGNADLHYALGLWYIRKSDEVNGMAELKKAAALNPSGAAVVYGYSVGLFSTGKPKEAVTVLENYLSKYGNDPLILEGLIAVYQDLKQPEKAIHYADIRKKVFGY